MSDDELDEALKSEVNFHADIYDLIHTLQSFDGGGKYHRVANDSLRVILRLRREYWELRDAIATVQSGDFRAARNLFKGMPMVVHFQSEGDDDQTNPQDAG